MRLDPAIQMLLDNAQKERMYGSIEIKFEAGKVVLAKRSETIKPQSYRDSRDEGDEKMNSGTHK